MKRPSIGGSGQVLDDVDGIDQKGWKVKTFHLAIFYVPPLRETPPPLGVVPLGNIYIK